MIPGNPVPMKQYMYMHGHARTHAPMHMDTHTHTFERKKKSTLTLARCLFVLQLVIIFLAFINVYLLYKMVGFFLTFSWIHIMNFDHIHPQLSFSDSPHFLLNSFFFSNSPSTLICHYIIYYTFIDPSNN